MALVVENPDSVLQILDQIGDAGTEELPPHRISLLKGIAYNEKQMFAYVDKYAREALESKDIKSNPKEETNALTLLACSQSYFGNIQGCIESLSRALEIARNTNNLPAELNVLTTMAKNYFTLGDRKSGYDSVEKVIQKGSSSQDVRVLANVSAAYGVKVKELRIDGQYSKSIEESRKRLELIARMDKVGGAPEGFTDQQRAYTYAGIASSAEKMGNRDAATKAFNDFSATKYGRSDGKYYITDYLLESKRFSTVLEYTRPFFARFEGSDTINNDFYDLLISNASAQYGLGNYKAGFNLLQRADVIRDSLYLREKNTQAEQLATMFSLKEKTLELEKEKAESQKRLILLWSEGGVCLLVIIILVILWRQYRITKRNQRIAVQRIEELIKERENHFQQHEEGDSGPDRKLFNEMEYKIIREKLFVNSSFNRDDIAKATGLSRNKVIQLIRQYTNLTPNDYINKLRVEHSVKLIKEHPEWSIDGIADSCGYVRIATYYSHFNKFYGITPAQYRRALKNASVGGEADIS